MIVAVRNCYGYSIQTGDRIAYTTCLRYLCACVWCKLGCMRDSDCAEAESGCGDNEACIELKTSDFRGRFNGK